MASDYGDDSGEKMLDGFTRLGERMGVREMYRRSDRLQQAFDKTKANTTAHETDAEGRVKWAKLDMTEFREADGYGELKQAVEGKMAERGVETAWFEDAEKGKEYLIFRVSDAHDVWSGFDELSEEARDAAGRAAKRIEGPVSDERTLEERAQQAREAAAALEAERAGAKAREHAPRYQELRSR